MHPISAFLWRVSDRLGRWFSGEECWLPLQRTVVSFWLHCLLTWRNHCLNWPQSAKMQNKRRAISTGVVWGFSKDNVPWHSRSRSTTAAISPLTDHTEVCETQIDRQLSGTWVPSHPGIGPCAQEWVSRTICHYWALHIIFSKIFRINIKTCLASCQLFHVTWIKDHEGFLGTCP